MSDRRPDPGDGHPPEPTIHPAPVPEEGPDAGRGARGPGGAPASQVDDDELIRRCRTGEEAAFETLVRRHQRRAVRVARNLVPSDEDAEDLAQEAFLRVFRSLERFDFQHEFSTWLYRIVTNLAIDHLRKRRPALSTTALPDEPRGDLELVDPREEGPSEPIEVLETGDAVRACLAALAPHFRSVLVLRELEGLACTEIAEIVGATHVTVRWRLHRGRKLFQEEWERRARLAEGAGKPLEHGKEQPQG